MANYYVNQPVGNDANDGSDWIAGKAWATLQHAWDATPIGSHIYVRTATYTEGTLLPAGSGSLGNPTIMQVYPGDVVIVDATGINTAYIFVFSGLSYITLDGFTIANATTNAAGMGVYCGAVSNNPTGITLKNLIVHDTNGSGIMFHGYSGHTMSNILIDHCTGYNIDITNHQEGFSLSSINNFEVKYCLVHDVTAGGQIGIDVKGGSHDGSIHNCEVYNALVGIYQDTYATGTANISIYSNPVHNCGTGIASSSETGEDVSDISIYNNILWNNDANHIVIWRPAGGGGPAIMTRTNIYCNTCYSTNAHPGWLGADARNYGTATGFVLVDCHITNNIIDTHLVAAAHYSLYTYGFDDQAALGIDHNLVYTLAELGLAAGTNYILADPQFTNPTGGAFHLKATSPARNAGSFALLPTYDYDGRLRLPFADIGSYKETNPQVASGIG